MTGRCIKDGFSLANRNVQLVIIGVIISALCLFSLFLFLGTSFIMGTGWFGFEPVHPEDVLPYLTGNPLELIARYLGHIVFVAVSLILSLSTHFLFFIYALGGTLGVLRNSALNNGFVFRLSFFFRAANTGFSPLFRLFSCIGSAVVVLLMIQVLCGGLAAFAVYTVTTPDSALGVFFRSFTLLALIFLSTAIFLSGLIFACYAAVVLIVDGKRVTESVRGTFAFVKKRPQALFLCLLILLFILFTDGAVLGIQLSLRGIPLMAPFVYLAGGFFRNYLAVVFWGSLISYYLKSTGSYSRA